jgi:hypothetical protein
MLPDYDKMFEQETWSIDFWVRNKEFATCQSRNLMRTNCAEHISYRVHGKYFRSRSLTNEQEIIKEKCSSFAEKNQMKVTFFTGESEDMFPATKRRFYSIEEITELDPLIINGVPTSAIVRRMRKRFPDLEDFNTRNVHSRKQNIIRQKSSVDK